LSAIVYSIWAALGRTVGHRNAGVHHSITNM
jgi:hypothetical protein